MTLHAPPAPALFAALRRAAVSGLCLLLACVAASAQPSPKHLRDCADCPELVALPAGSFRMGSPPQEVDRDSDEDLRSGVRIAAFAMGRYETTVAQYLACVQAGACTAPLWQSDRRLFTELSASVEAPQHPIVGVSWQQAQSYVQWLSRTTGKNYYLPSEAQWEYAARAGTTTAWSFGDASQASQYAWSGDNSGNALHPVGSLRPNAWGLHDMHGNVWEWVQDCYNAACNQRVARGGSWYDGLARLRSASRYYNSPLHPTSRVGIRVARAL